VSTTGNLLLILHIIHVLAFTPAPALHSTSRSLLGLVPASFITALVKSPKNGSTQWSCFQPALYRHATAPAFKAAVFWLSAALADKFELHPTA
jgi:hypothetical protein